jgi:polyhydroxybutyrate depolymerase
MAGQILGCKSVDETVKTWVKLDGCPEKPTTESLPHKTDDSTAVRRSTYGPGSDGSEVILIEIEGGGHTWPGAASFPPIERMLGKTTHDISANELIWAFFERHPMK